MTMDSACSTCSASDAYFQAGPFRLAATVIGGAGAQPSLLTLAGLGALAKRATVHYLMEDLAQRGLVSMSFDFSGNGDSEGVFEDGSLRRRERETLAAAGLLAPHKPPVLLGTSMGSYLAACVAPVLKPRALVLFCPSAYPDYVLDVKFDGNLARSGAYPNSPAFAAIASFTGDLLIIGGSHDHVVPREVLQHYMDCATRARSKELVWLDCDHFIHRWLPQQAGLREDIVARIAAISGLASPS
jgi:alpha-beta hydrolase superfamily lysophospholipase